MNIGEVAAVTGLTAKTIRYYESVGLMKPSGRTPANYRVYAERDVMTLRFVERARRLGFSLKEVGELLALWHDRRRKSADVRRMAAAQMTRINARLAELTQMRRTLEHLIDSCQGNDRPDCPILDELAGGKMA